jgi:siderophore synthetase component
VSQNGRVPRTPASAAPSRHTPGPEQTRAGLAALRPDLLTGYDAELPGARAAVLARLIGALDREPLPGLAARGPGLVRFADGTTVRYPAGAAALFAPGTPGLSVHVARSADRPGEPATAVDDPATLVRLLWPANDPAHGSARGPAGGRADRLAAEVGNSVANMALARADRATTDPGDDLGRLEQLPTDGHPVHPCCRTRGGMTVADVLAYAPEHHPVIRLRRLRVPPDRWYGTAPPVLYAHPWQADRLRDRYPWLADDGETGPARPLMSLRTVAPLDGGPHVKTAVEVQMTSAVRTVSPAAVHNGPVLSRLFRQVAAGLPIDILAETDAGAVVVDGRPRRELAFVRREAPRLGPGETAVPMAVLPSRLAGVHDAYGFLVLLAEKLFAPLLELLRRGLALEAHGQNTLVVLRDGRPSRILYRDLGGVRVSARRLTAGGFEAPALDGDLAGDDPRELRSKLSASAISSVAAELIDAFERAGHPAPGRLWTVVAEALGRTADGRLIRREPLPIKATTAMRLAADPLDDQWAYLDNPMAA